MPRLIDRPARIAAAGEPPKLIEEFVGRASSGHAEISIARMTSPSGWSEPAQRPDFTEYTLVLHGELLVEADGGVIRVVAGEAVIVEAGERVRYSTPGSEGAEYIAVCLPAFSPETVHREA
jgi:quercetin dioxygenase-like cupin family protein